jgi:pSer/pThr/pTyr-binding forkhead associated (FHA) protein
VLRQQRFDSNQVLIGRSFSADMILTDPYVDAEHCILSCDPDSGQLRLKDRGAKNGLWWLDEKHNKQRVISERAIDSGQTLLLGKTYLRIYHHRPFLAPRSFRRNWPLSGSQLRMQCSAST